MKIAVRTRLFTKGDMQINSGQLRLVFCTTYF